MDFRFTAHNPETGSFLHRLPRPEKVQMGRVWHTRNPRTHLLGKGIEREADANIRRDPATGHIRQRRELVRHRTQLSAPVRIP